MQQAWADALWSTMDEGKFYSVKDLANLMGEAGSSVGEVIHFLSKYGFVKRVGSNDPVYTRTDIAISPGESIGILKQLVKTQAAKVNQI